MKIDSLFFSVNPLQIGMESINYLKIQIFRRNLNVTLKLGFPFLKKKMTLWANFHKYIFCKCSKMATLIRIGSISSQ